MEDKVQHFIPPNIADAIGHTLVYSLGVGIVLAFLVALSMVLMQKSSAALRYQLLVGVLFGYVLIILFILWSALFPPVTGIANLPGNKFPAIWLNKASFILKYTHEHTRTMVSIWLFLVMLQSIRMLLGLYTLECLKKVEIIVVASTWEDRLNHFSRELGINRAVSLLGSGIAKVPLVIGYLKPVILVPVGLFSFLEPAQVEAILLHELAHIRRMDYLVISSWNEKPPGYPRYR